MSAISCWTVLPSAWTLKYIRTHITSFSRGCSRALQGFVFPWCLARVGFSCGVNLVFVLGINLSVGVWRCRHYSVMAKHSRPSSAVLKALWLPWCLAVIKSWFWRTYVCTTAVYSVITLPGVAGKYVGQRRHSFPSMDSRQGSLSRKCPLEY